MSRKKIFNSVSYLILSTLIFLLTFIAGCSSSGDGEEEKAVSIEEKIPSVEPIEAAMKTMTPLGYAASMFMAKIRQPEVADKACELGFCITTLEIPFDQPTRDAFPVPLEAEGTAKLYVAGAWSENLSGSAIKTAVISLLFIDMRGGSFGLPTYKITAVPVTKTSSGISTAYATSDIGFDKDGGLIDTVKEEVKTNLKSIVELNFDNIVDQLSNFVASDNLAFYFDKDYWVVTVNESGNTPEVYTDDEYALTGGGLYAKAGITSGSVQLMGLKDVVMQNSCITSLNSGEAYIVEVDAGTDVSNLIGAHFVELQFDDQCDGKAYVKRGFGGYGTVSGGRVPLQFNQ